MYYFTGEGRENIDTTQLRNAREDTRHETLVVLMNSTPGRLALAQSFVASILAVRIDNSAICYCGHEPLEDEAMEKKVRLFFMRMISISPHPKNLRIAGNTHNWQTRRVNW